MLRIALFLTIVFPFFDVAAQTDEAPVIEFVGDREVEAIETLGINVFAYSSRSGVPWLWVESLPAGAEFFDRGEGFRTFLWSPGPAQVGEHSITFIAADASDQSLRTEVDVTITVLPGTFTSPAFSIVAPSTAEAVVGNLLSVRVAAINSDGSVPALIGLDMPQGATLDDNGDGSRTFNWVPSAEDIGSHLIRFEATPVNMPNFSTNHDLFITVTSDAPVISFPVAPGVVAGETMSFPVSATNPHGNVPALMIDSLPGNATFTDNGDGTRQFEWVTTDNDIGDYSFTITALDTETGDSTMIDVYLSVQPDPALATGDQVVLVAGRVTSLEIENVELEQNFDDSMNVVTAVAGFLVAETDLIINDEVRAPVTLVPGTNTIILESTTDSQRIVLNISRSNFPQLLFPAIDATAIAVDIDDSTIAIGDRLFELDETRLVSESRIGAEMEVSYVTSIDVSNNTAALASRERPQDGVWLYERSVGSDGNSEWRFDQHLTPDYSLHPEGMGTVVVLEGDTLAIGAVYDSGSSLEGVTSEYRPGAGAVVIYQRGDDGWQYATTLYSSNPESNDYFGHALALEGDTLVVSAIGEDSNSVGVNGDQINNEFRDAQLDLYSAGAAYVFEREDGSWQQTAYLKPSTNGLPAMGFGHAVAVFEDTIAVTAIDAPRAGDEAIAVQALQDGRSADVYRTGNVFVYERSDTSWVQSHRLSAPADNWRFGLDIDLKTNQLLVLTQARAFFYERSDENWQLIWDDGTETSASVAAFNYQAMVFGGGHGGTRVYTGLSR